MVEEQRKDEDFPLKIVGFQRLGHCNDLACKKRTVISEELIRKQPCDVIEALDSLPGKLVKDDLGADSVED
jgi:hypothetical protein